jgi:hypothetical protein
MSTAAFFEGPLRPPPRSLTPTNHSRPFYHGSEFAAARHPHLISCELWEAMTGERVSPDHLTRLFDSSIPNSEPSSEASSHFISMARDRQGSRFLQQRINDCTPRERKLIFESLLPVLGELVMDPTSNYVIQKLCEYMNPDQELHLLQFFLSDLHTVIDHQNGCRVLQKFMDHASPGHVDQLFCAVRPEFIHLGHSTNGNHIVQKFIVGLPSRLDDIIALLKPHVLELVVDNCGCRVIQKLFDHYEIAQLRPLVTEILGAAANLATNQYGNYVVQTILERGPDEDVVALMRTFVGCYYDFSIHKFASNVIEKCIRRSSPTQRDAIFVEIIGSHGNWECQRILTMVSDQFGNYVIQRIIEFGTEDQQAVVYDVVYDNYEDLLQQQYSRHVINKLERLGYEF